MRAVVQRVLGASVTIDEKIVSKIETGLLALIAFTEGDKESDFTYIMNKLLNLRIFEDENQVMNKSLQDKKLEVLLVSQFTLYGDVRKGNRPSYIKAMKPDNAINCYQSFVEKFTTQYPKTKSGVFGANMKVALINDGPTTILLDSSKII